MKEHFHPLIYHLQKFKFTGYFGTIFCMIILVSFGGCAKHSVESLAATPATYGPDVALGQQAYQAMASGDYETGIRLYEQIIENDPANGTAMYHLGYGYGKIGELYQEISYYEKAIALGYQTDQIYRNLGMVYLWTDQVEEGFRAFKKALSIKPNSADNHFAMGLAHQRGGNYEMAEKEFLRAIRIEPRVIEFRETLALFYQERGDSHKAAEQFEQILEIDPNHEGAREFLNQIVKKEALEKKGLPGIGGQ
jgi:tetratricopeptide (TPR) repeat protein